MSKELKAPDKVTQKMTRDGAVAENLTTGETSSISERPQEENYSAPAGVAAEKVVQHIGAEIERHAAKGAEKKALDATQPKTHSSRLQFSEAERATPELQKAIKKSDKAADCLDAARAAIPKQTKIKKERVFDEAKGKAKTRLSFEKTDKPPNGKLRHNPLSRPAQELNSTVHGKIYEVEKENVGVESGHRVELAGEKAGGMAARAVKGAEYRHCYCSLRYGGKGWRDSPFGHPIRPALYRIGRTDGLLRLLIFFSYIKNCPHLLSQMGTVSVL